MKHNGIRHDDPSPTGKPPISIAVADKRDYWIIAPEIPLDIIQQAFRAAVHGMCLESST